MTRFFFSLCISWLSALSISTTTWASVLPSIDSSTPIQIQADQQDTQFETGETQFRGHVVVTYGSIRIESSEARVSGRADGKPSVASFFNRPTLIQSQAGYSSPNIIKGEQFILDIDRTIFQAKGAVDTVIATVAQGPVTVRSDVQQFNNQTRQVSASGHVKVQLPGTKVQSNRAVMRLNEQGDAERAVFSGGVTLNQDTNLIKSERLTVLVASKNLVAERNVRTVVNNPKDGSKVWLNSDYQQFDNTHNTILASGHVRLVYGDYVVTGPKATFYLTKNGSKTDIDHILLSGRPTINDKQRQITADTIVLTTNPPNFKAKGHVKTRFVGQPSRKPQTKKAVSTTSKQSGKVISKPVIKPIVTEEDELLLED